MSESLTPEAPAKAAKVAPPELPRGYVSVRITKLGDGLVATGEHTIETGYTFYRKGEIIPLPQTVADDLEARGFAEIQD